MLASNTLNPKDVARSLGKGVLEIYQKIPYYLKHYQSKDPSYVLEGDDGRMWLGVSLSWWSERTGMARNTVLKNIRILMDHELILSWSSGEGRTNYYRINEPVQTSSKTSSILNRSNQFKKNHETPSVPSVARENLNRSNQFNSNENFELVEKLQKAHDRIRELEESKNLNRLNSAEHLEKPHENELPNQFNFEPVDNSVTSSKTSSKTSSILNRYQVNFDTGSHINSFLPFLPTSVKEGKGEEPLLLPADFSLSESEGGSPRFGAPTPPSPPEPPAEEVELSEKAQAVLRSSREPMANKVFRRQLALRLGEKVYLGWLANGCYLRPEDRGWVLVFDSWFKADWVADKFGPQISEIAKTLGGCEILCIGPATDTQRAARPRQWISCEEHRPPGGLTEVNQAFEDLVEKARNFVDETKRRPDVGKADSELCVGDPFARVDMPGVRERMLEAQMWLEESKRRVAATDENYTPYPIPKLRWEG